MRCCYYRPTLYTAAMVDCYISRRIIIRWLIVELILPKWTCGLIIFFFIILVCWGGVTEMTVPHNPCRGIRRFESWWMKDPWRRVVVPRGGYYCVWCLEWVLSRDWRAEEGAPSMESTAGPPSIAGKEEAQRATPCSTSPASHRRSWWCWGWGIVMVTWDGWRGERRECLYCVYCSSLVVFETDHLRWLDALI